MKFAFRIYSFVYVRRRPTSYSNGRRCENCRGNKVWFMTVDENPTDPERAEETERVSGIFNAFVRPKTSHQEKVVFM